MFRYCAYNPAAAEPERQPGAAALPRAVAAAWRPPTCSRVVRITIGFTAYPENSNSNDKLAANFNGDFLSRSAASPYEFSEPPTDPAVVEPRCR